MQTMMVGAAKGCNDTKTKDDFRLEGTLSMVIRASSYTHTITIMQRYPTIVHLLPYQCLASRHMCIIQTLLETSPDCEQPNPLSKIMNSNY